MLNKKEKKKDIISSVFGRMFAVQMMTMLTGIAGSVVDGMVTGSFLGEDAVAAFGFTTSVTLLVAIIASVLSTGTSLVCGISLGEGRPQEAVQKFSACFTLTLFTALLLAVFSYVMAEPLVRLTGASEELVPYAVDYVRGYAIAGPFIMFVSLLMPIMQMDGEMNRLLAAVVAMTAGDIAADLLNVMVFHRGMFGMALATAASYALALLFLIPHFFKKDILFSLPRIRWDGATCIRAVSGGLPNAASMLGRLILAFILNRYLLALAGAPAVTAHTVIMSMANLCMVPGTALSAAAEVITGVLYGEEDKHGLSNMMHTAMRYNLAANGITMLAFIILAEPLTGMFYQGSSAALDMTITGFRFYALCMIFYGINLITRSYCQGTGQVKLAYLITMSDGFVLPLLFILLLGSLFGTPYLWIGYVLGEGLTTAWMLISFIPKRSEYGLIPFPAGFAADTEAVFEYTISEIEPVLVSSASESMIAFCREHGADTRTALIFGIAAEEMTGSIMEHGFNDGKKHRIEMRMIRKSDGWIMRMRDDCRRYDPTAEVADDPVRSFGIRMLKAVSTDVRYLGTLDLNNLLIFIGG